MYDVIIIGSGAAGAWAAFQLVRRGLRICVIDVGNRPRPQEPLEGNLYDLKMRDEEQWRYLIGAKFESLHNLHRDYLSPRLKAPRFRFVTERATELSPIEPIGFAAVQSMALGGLANAWGAGAYRFNEGDLERFPIRLDELDPYYDELTAQIGIAGTEDDLLEHFGSARELQNPVRLGRLALRMMEGYNRRPEDIRREGIRLGAPRLAILTRPMENRRACQYDNLSFWEPELSSIYTPTMTMKRLIDKNAIDYEPEQLALHFSEKGSIVELTTTDLTSNKSRQFTARRLILAAGTLNSSRIVLRSFQDTSTKLPLLENSMSWTPLLHPAEVGSPVDRDNHGLVQLNLLYKGPLHEDYLQGSVFCYTSPLAADVWRDFPLSAYGNALCCRYLLPAMAILQLNYSDSARPDNYLRLGDDGRLTTHRGWRLAMGAIERHLIKTFRKMGFLSHPALIRFPEPGNAIHYAGSLPMTEDLSVHYRTNRQCRLACAKRVYVADAASFPYLPAKNHTFTIMANAMRVADAVAEDLKVRM